MKRASEVGPPCLLTMPFYSGTLAAVRAFGERGIDVTVAGRDLLAPARWSRYARRVVPCPDPLEGARFREWLLRFGDEHPGHFLYPTCDDLAWLFASEAAALRQRFVMYQPPVETMVRLLDKRSLRAACAEVGVATVPTWFPAGVEDLRRIAGEIELPVVIKPRTQVMLGTRNKGAVVERREELVSRYLTHVRSNLYSPVMRKDFGDVSLPMLQTFYSEASNGTYSISGFIDEQGELLAARASRKVLQRPRRVGVGLCFESAPVDPEAIDGIVRLCRNVGYYGVFEVEFAVRGGVHFLIDFNPRFYGQMAFETARGMPLPLFVWHAASGHTAELAELARRSRELERADDGRAYCFRVPHEVLLALRRAAGTTSREEYARWRRWSSDRAGRILGFSEDARDHLPWLVHTASDLWYSARYARGFYRGCVLDEC